MHDFLEFDADAGPHSGKTILAVIAYFASWVVLHVLWRRQNPTLRSVVIATAVLDRPRRARNVPDVLPGVCV